MAGSSWTDSDYSNSWINGSHYRNDLIQTLNAANKIAWDNTGTGASQWGIMSFFGRVAYNFDSKYLLTVTCVPTVLLSCILIIVGGYSHRSQLPGVYLPRSLWLI